jgi:23S rRNA maturation mini-RNase III
VLETPALASAAKTEAPARKANATVLQASSELTAVLGTLALEFLAKTEEAARMEFALAPLGS